MSSSEYTIPAFHNGTIDTTDLLRAIKEKQYLQGKSAVGILVNKKDFDGKLPEEVLIGDKSVPIEFGTPLSGSVEVKFHQ